MIVGFDGVGAAIGNLIDLADLTGATLSFRGTSGFTGVNQVRVLNNGTSTEIDINLSGSTAADAVILVQDGAITASQWQGADFIL